ncbi:MAG: peptidoglycan-binding protein [Myxococcaceae bacterium]
MEIGRKQWGGTVVNDSREDRDNPNARGMTEARRSGVIRADPTARVSASTSAVDTTTVEPHRSVVSHSALSNPRFPAESAFDSVASGHSRLARGSSGPAVKTLQGALSDLGYSLPKYGTDGKFGAETAAALKAFQADRMLSATGILDAPTLRELDGAAPPPNEKATLYPEYEKLFRDGVLNVTVGMGYDEEGSDLWQREKLLDGLAQRGFRPLDPASDAQLRELHLDRGTLDPTARYFAKRFDAGGREVTALVRYVDRSSADPKAQFAKGMSGSEVVLYGGHARYGSGPDFDPIDSTAGNFVLGVNSKGHRDGTLTKAYDEHMRELLGDAPNDLERTRLTDDYQLMVFSGCRTKDYLDELRGIPKNKDRRNLDVLVSDDLLSWANTTENLLTSLDDVMGGKSVNALQSDLKRVNGVSFTADGFGGNAEPTTGVART